MILGYAIMFSMASQEKLFAFSIFFFFSFHFGIVLVELKNCIMTMVL